MIEIPLRTRCAECNRSIDAVKAHVEVSLAERIVHVSSRLRRQKHFEARGTAARNAMEAMDRMVDRPRTAEVSKRRPVFRKLKAQTDVVLRQTARERMLHFSRQLDERRNKGASQRVRHWLSKEFCISSSVLCLVPDRPRRRRLLAKR